MLFIPGTANAVFEMHFWYRLPFQVGAFNVGVSDTGSLGAGAFHCSGFHLDSKEVNKLLC